MDLTTLGSLEGLPEALDSNILLGKCGPWSSVCVLEMLLVHRKGWALCFAGVYELAFAERLLTLGLANN